MTRDLVVHRLDILGYMNDLLGITPHVGQEAFFSEVFPRNVEPQEWPYRMGTIVAANRWAKSVSFSVIQMWSATYKHLLPFEYGSPDWWDAPYPIINLCPLVDLSTVVREKIGEVLDDTAKEQLERVGGRGHIDPRIPALFNVNPQPKGKSRHLLRIDGTEYDGYRTIHNATMEFRTTADSAKAIQGRKYYVVTFDEFTREKDPEQLLASDIRPRTLDTRGIIINGGTPHLETVSTAEDVYETGNPANPDRDPHHISMQRGIGDNPAITPTMIEELVSGTPDYLKPQILEGKFVQSEDAFFSAVSIQKAQRDVPNCTGMKRERRRGHTYVCSWDLAVAKAGDRSIGIVWDVTLPPYKVVEYLEEPKGTKQDALVADMKAMMEWYGNERMGCSVLMTYDQTGMGGRMFLDDLATLRPRPRGFDFAGARHKKLSILTSLKLFLDKGLLIYPKECTRITHELKRYKRSDEKLETDAVMALAMAAHYAERFGRARVARTQISESMIPA